MPYVVEYPTKEEDETIRDLLRDNPIPGGISLAYTKDPSFLKATEIMGTDNHTLVCKLDGKIIGIGCASFLNMYVNEKIEFVCYLHSLRVDKGFRKSLVLANIYKKFNELNDKYKFKFFLTTLIDDNSEATKILTKKKRSIIPQYHRFCSYTTNIVSLTKEKPLLNNNIIIEKTNNINEIVNFINVIAIKKQFYPSYDETFFKNLLGFNLKNFYVAKKEGQIVGVASKWDQGSFKQSTVYSYSPLWKVIRFFNNIFSKHKMPAEKEAFKFFYISFIAIENDDPNILKELLYKINNDNIIENYHYFVIGFSESDPLKDSIKSFKSIKYNSAIYLASFEDLNINNFDKVSVPYLELGRL